MREHIESLICGFPAAIRQGRWMVMLVGYIDDSGTNEGKHQPDHCVLAGFVSTPPRWMKFSDDWERLCLQDPPTPTFKMQKAVRLDSHGYGWTQDERDKRLRELASASAKHVLYRVDSRIRWADYETEVKGKIDPGCDNPYFILFQSVIMSVIKLMEFRNIADTVDWYFDEHGLMGQMANQWFIEMKKMCSIGLTGKLGSGPAFRDDDKVLPLKASDMYAWLFRTECDGRLEQSGVLRSSYEQLNAVQGISSIIQPEDLQHFVGHWPSKALSMKMRWNL